MLVVDDQLRSLICDVDEELIVFLDIFVLYFKKLVDESIINCIKSVLSNTQVIQEGFRDAFKILIIYIFLNLLVQGITETFDEYIIVFHLRLVYIGVIQSSRSFGDNATKR